jgi:hypothetical protein
MQYVVGIIGKSAQFSNGSRKGFLEEKIRLGSLRE